MKKLRLIFSLLLAAMLCGSAGFAQDWVKMMQDPTVNFFDVQKAFYKEYGEKEKEMARERNSATTRQGQAQNEMDEIPGYTQFKRWEWFMKPRVGQNGERFDPSQAYTEYQKYASANRNSAAGNWTFMGPATSGSLSGAGRLNFVRVHPTNSQIIYVGSPGGGLWKSTDGGTNWSTNTDWAAQVIGYTDLAIDPTNTNVMYAATGDGDGGDTYSVGLLKSTDGGATWGPSGLSFGMGNYTQMSKVLINPNNTSIILVATSSGVYRSTDAAATFTKVLAGGFKDMEFKPADPNTVYVCGVSFYRSTNAGLNWTVVTTGLPAAAAISRMAIATTAADPTIVYGITGLPGTAYGTEGFYRSNNSGVSFTKISTPANLGNQQWYDLAIGASPTNAQECIVGGQTAVIRTTNGGTSFTTIAGTTHVDYHDVIFTSGTQIYLTSDGGVYSSANDGTSWTNLNHNLAIAEMYGFGQSTTNANLTLQGWQDNGTNIGNGAAWSATMGGDGMLAFIGRTNDNNMWGSQYNGSLNRSTNGGGSWAAANTGITGTGAWVTPWREDPVTANTLWTGFNQVFKSANGGASWTQAGTLPGTITLSLAQLAISPANNQVVWATDGPHLYKSTNGGGAWTLNSSATMPHANITYIACSNTDANKVWITFSGFANHYKVFQSNDQGTTWFDVASQSLPNIPVDCITYVNGSANDALYIGTDVGCFYKDNTLNVWQPFSAGLPNVTVTQLEILYSTGKIRASTYGRGMWETDQYVAGAYAPSANFVADKRIACPGTAVQFTDYSAGVPTSWNWTFTGGSPASSTSQNPVVTYNTPGVWPVTLVATNVNGTDSRTVVSYINITASTHAAPTASDVNFCSPASVTLNATPSVAGTVRWWDAAGGGAMVGTGNSYTTPVLNGSTTYWVDEDFPAESNQDFVGEVGNGIGAGAFFTANDIRGDFFDVTQPCILNTVQVYANSAGNRTIEVIDAQGNTYIDTTVFIPANPTTLQDVTLNFPLYPGTGYFIKCRGYVDLYRNSAGAVFPYSSSAINITGTNANGAINYYYYFYNWTYTTFVCNTSRTPVNAIDNCTTGINSLAGVSGSLNLFPNPSNGLFTLSFNTESSDNYSIKIVNSLGQSVYEEKLAAFVGKYAQPIDLRKFGKGMYTLTISNSSSEAVRKVVVF